MIQKILVTLFAFILVAALTITQATALIITSADAPDLTPGAETTLDIEVENNGDADVEDVSLTLSFTNLPLSSVGSSDESVDEIEEDEEESFTFRIRASPNAEPGDYQIPYTLNYKDSTAVKTGTIGVRVTGTVDIITSVTTNTPVVGQQDQLEVKVINKGFADARFVSVTLIPEGLQLRSEPLVYIGDISTDDFETATFDITHQRTDAVAEILIEYRDFNNVKQTKRVIEPLTVYTNERAVELGLIQKDNTAMYVLVLVIVIILWIIWRSIAKRRRMKKSMQANAAR